MQKEPSHWVLAYYHIHALKDPQAEVAIHKAFCEPLDITCRVYISEEGINGQMSATRQDAETYISWMKEHPEFNTVRFKIHPYHEHVYPRKTIKYRKQLVAIDTQVDLSQRGQHVSPQQWREMLDTEADRVLIDVRNDYEWKVGHFDGADLPACETFRDFSDYADELQKKKDPKKTPVMMYCTGGIRCELYSAILKKKGFEKVYQLDGGIIGYGLEQGSKHWKGKLFVFDDRLTVPVCEKEETPVVGSCHHCGQPNEAYYNCANMDCNHLFLCCPQCLLQFAGCCCSDCMQAPRRRPHHEQNAHKPFRKWYNYEKDMPAHTFDHKKRKCKNNSKQENKV